MVHSNGTHSRDPEIGDERSRLLLSLHREAKWQAHLAELIWRGGRQEKEREEDPVQKGVIQYPL